MCISRITSLNGITYRSIGTQIHFVVSESFEEDEEHEEGSVCIHWIQSAVIQTMAVVQPSPHGAVSCCFSIIHQCSP